MRVPVLLFLSLLLSQSGSAQVETRPVEGLRENTPRLHVLRGGTIWTKPGERIENGTIVLRGGRIEAVGGADLEVPGNARIWDIAGRNVYPGFIDAASTLGEQTSVSGNHTHWSKLVRPERRAAEFEPPGEDDLVVRRGLGFTTAQVLPDSGIFRGQSCAVDLGADPSVVAPDLRQCLSFATSGSDYPGSLMGSVALVRQALHDARWYRDMAVYLREHPEAERAEANTSLDSLAPVVAKTQPLLVHARDELDYDRFLGITREFQLDAPVILGNGYEYRQAGLLSRSGAGVIVPLNFPKAPPVENPEVALELSLEKLEHWERAPANAAALAAEGVPISLTAWNLDKPKDNFWKRVRECVDHGLDPGDALAALTVNPAAILGLSDRTGSVEPGKMANLVVAAGDLFREGDSSVLVTWIDGIPYETDAAKRVDVRGEWTLQWTGVEAPGKWEVGGSLESPSLEVDGVDFSIRGDVDRVELFPPADYFGDGRKGTARLAGYVNRDTGWIRGTGSLPGGEVFSWGARIARGGDAAGGEGKESGDTDEEEEGAGLPRFSKYPAGAFGLSRKPEQPSAVLVRNATIWTSAEAGRLEKADLLVRGGKVAKIAPKIPAPGGEKVVVIDARGKHVTPGLIDCHSHSAISRGINEGTHAVTVEVRIGDVINPADIALYRELAGGLTTANILHGSANPMGGQNQVIKLRWGSSTADGLRFDGARPGVKFALGENVKRSNWDSPTDRYPETRMGVEQIMKDTFLAARDYEKARVEAEAEGRPHRRNLRLEAVLEILGRERIVHIHSYRQDEILMFVRLCQEFGIEVGTFQHVLEGYKVADAIAEIDAGGSAFSDWWAYKFEVYDAIPYNGALMHRAGVVTSFNSDSNELATRLNTEAAKAVKYGGLSPEKALEFVTINPAKQLRIDERVGSLEPGKDADFVIWSAHPLSGFARAEQTWIDGRRYFDLETDRALREEALEERERLIALVLPKRMKNLATQKAKKALDEETGSADSSAGKPGLLPYLFRDRVLECRSLGLDLYHDGADSHTCTSNCCGLR